MSALFFDIDGTIISEKTKKVPESTIEGLHKAREKGHYLFINTGRTVCALSPALKGLPFDGYLCGCGTYLLYRDQVLEKHEIPYERGVQIIDQMKEFKIEGVLEGIEDVYFSENTYRCKDLERSRWELGLWGLGRSTFMERKDFRYDKLYIHVDDRSEKEAFFRALEEEIEFIDRRNNFYECVQKGYSKATAIEFFQRYLGLSLDQIYVFGDSSNDEPMFHYATHTIAMGYHDEMLDPMTEYVTDTVENGGIYQALEHFQLI